MADAVLSSAQCTYTVYVLVVGGAHFEICLFLRVGESKASQPSRINLPRLPEKRKKKGKLRERIAVARRYTSRPRIRVVTNTNYLTLAPLGKL